MTSSSTNVSLIKVVSKLYKFINIDSKKYNKKGYKYVLP